MKEETLEIDYTQPTPRQNVLNQFEERGLKHITPEELSTLNPKFYNMLSRLPRYGEDGIKDKMLTFQDKQDPNRFYVKLYTSAHSYSISCRIDDERDYLGCTARTRKCRAGEDWNRGNDLADGGFTEATFNEIVLDIVGYELRDLDL